MRDTIRIRPLPDARPGQAERRWYGALVAQLTARRAALGLSQAALEHRLGLATGQVGKYEQLARVPNPFLLMCWCQALGLALVALPEEAYAAVG
jgi:transcriptional regulator with XRE-family HTH domain